MMQQGKKADQQNITAANIHMLHVHTDCCTNKMTSKVKNHFLRKRLFASLGKTLEVAWLFKKMS